MKSQQKIDILGHDPPFHNLIHLSSGAMCRVSVSRPRASFVLKLPEVEYPHISLSGSSLLENLFLESSATKFSMSSPGALSCHHRLSFHILILWYELLLSQKSATFSMGLLWRKERKRGVSSPQAMVGSWFRASLENLVVWLLRTSQKLCFWTRPLFSWAVFHMEEPGISSPNLTRDFLGQWGAFFKCHNSS